MELLEQYITTVEIAEMMEMRHDSILRKLEGQEVKGKRIKGVLEIMTDHNLGVSEYFICSTYKDSSGKENKCYNCTRKGCELLAHKFQGEKGILFTIKYIERFHKMEEAIKQLAIQQQHQQQEQKQIGHSNTYLLPMSDSWFNEMNDVFERVCQFYHWKRSKLYHEILNELGEIYNIQQCVEMYTVEKGKAPDYIMEVVEWFPQLRNETVRIMQRYSSLVP